MTSNSNTQTISNSIAMSLVLIMIGMLFGTLMLSYFVYRWTSDQWPPLGIERPNIIIPLCSSILILISSWSYWVFEKGLKAHWFYMSAAAGVFFLVCQLFFWHHLDTIGLYTHTGTYSSLLHAFTWIHAAHVVIGLLCFLWTYSLIRKNSTIQHCFSIKNTGMLWHFLTMIWMVLFINLFVL